MADLGIQSYGGRQNTAGPSKRTKAMELGCDAGGEMLQEKCICHAAQPHAGAFPSPVATLNLCRACPNHMARTFSEVGWEGAIVPADPFAEDALGLKCIFDV